MWGEGACSLAASSVIGRKYTRDLGADGRDFLVSRFGNRVSRFGTENPCGASEPDDEIFEAVGVMFQRIRNGAQRHTDIRFTRVFCDPT